MRLFVPSEPTHIAPISGIVKYSIIEGIYNLEDHPGKFVLSIFAGTVNPFGVPAAAHV